MPAPASLQSLAAGTCGNYSTPNASDNLVLGPVGGSGTQPPFTQTITWNLQGPSVAPRTDLFWLWTPPSLGTGLDLKDFPTPQNLFCLAKTAASMEVKGATNLTQVKASGSLKDSVTGLSLPSLGSYNATTGTWRAPADTVNTADRVAVSRVILPMNTALPAARIPGAERLKTISLQPSLQPTGSLSVHNPAGNGQANLNARLYEFGFPIHMTYPDVFYRPDNPSAVYQNPTLAGNQFVYNSGVLLVPAQIDLIDASLDSANSELKYPANDPGDAAFLWPNSTQLNPGPLVNSDPAVLVGWTFQQGTGHQAPISNYKLLPTTLTPTPQPDGTYLCTSANLTVKPKDIVLYNTRFSQGLDVPALSFHGSDATHLPVANGDFGNYIATLTVKTQPGKAPSNSEVAYIQTFFSGQVAAHDHPIANMDSQNNLRYDLQATQNGTETETGTGDPHWDYPASLPGPISAPNWYHYYTQVYPMVGTQTDFWPSMSYTGQAGNSVDGYKISNPNSATPVYNIHLGTDMTEGGAVSKITTFPVFALDTTIPNDPNNPAAYVQHVGDITLQRGIMSYLYIASHEYGHQLAFSTPGVSNEDANGVVQQTQYPTYHNLTTVPPSDKEFDNLSMKWKELHHLNPNSSDTTGAYPNDSPWQVGVDKPDNELVADITALGLMFQYKQIWMQDWADTGVQYYQSFTDNSGNTRIGLPALVPISMTDMDLFFTYTPVNSSQGINVLTVQNIQDSVDQIQKAQNQMYRNGTFVVLQSLNQFIKLGINPPGIN